MVHKMMLHDMNAAAANAIYDMVDIGFSLVFNVCFYVVDGVIVREPSIFHDADVESVSKVVSPFMDGSFICIYNDVAQMLWRRPFMDVRHCK